jgi:transcriptional regulator with XRE-family HTH domain
MSVVLDVNALGRELARRGWNLRDLARAAGISAPTASAARAGRPISPASLRLIVRALLATPPLEGVDSLLAGNPAIDDSREL